MQDTKIILIGINGVTQEVLENLAKEMDKLLTPMKIQAIFLNTTEVRLIPLKELKEVIDRLDKNILSG